MENELIYAGFRPFSNLQEANEFMAAADAVAPEENHFFIDVLTFKSGKQFYNVHAHLSEKWYLEMSMYFDTMDSH